MDYQNAKGLGYQYMEDEAADSAMQDMVAMEHQLTVDEAERCLAKIRNWERYKEFWATHFDTQKQATTERAERNIAYQKARLQGFFRAMPHQRSKTGIETYPLASATLRMTPGGDKLMKPKQEDEHGIRMWLLENGIKGYVKTVESLDWQELKKRLTVVNGKAVDKETGEVVDAIPVTHCEPEFTIRDTSEKTDMKEE